jgi:quercetin dioxygenase-like cupin family protein
MNATTQVLSDVSPTAASPLNVFGVGVTLLLDGAATGGSHVVARLVCAPGAGAPPHRHAEAESFCVTEGAVEIWSGGTWTVFAAGDFAHVPPGEAHAFRNTGTVPAHILNISAPAGHDRFFREADALHREGRFTPETAAQVCDATGIELLPPPGT